LPLLLPTRCNDNYYTNPNHHSFLPQKRLESTMLFLMDTYETEPDHNGNSRKIFRLLCVDAANEYKNMEDFENQKKTPAPKVTNILWRDVGPKGYPSDVKDLHERYDVTTVNSDKLEHVQNHKLEPGNWNDLVAEQTTL